MGSIDIKELLTLKHTLRFDANGKFRIMIMTDLHGGKGQSKQLAKAIRACVEETKPNLVLIGGDTSGCSSVHVKNAAQLHEALAELCAPMEEKHIPWAHVFGNHDDNHGLPNCEAEPVYESFAYCVSKYGPMDVYGVANYVLPILASGDNSIKFNVFGFDSHGNTKGLCRYLGRDEDTKFIMHEHHFYNGRDYDTIRFEQIMWYWQASKALEEYNGAKIPAMVYTHVPLPEHLLIAANRGSTNYRGDQWENVASTELNSGMFAACFERGDVKAIICGHDHINTFIGNYCGIMLGYAGGLDYDCYQMDELRSVRVMDLDEDFPEKIDSSIVYLRNILGSEGDKHEKV